MELSAKTISNDCLETITQNPKILTFYVTRIERKDIPVQER
jgi:hypothetical protein